MRDYLSKPETMLKTIALLIVVSGALPLSAAEPVLSRADEIFLKEQARRIVNSARLAAGESSGQWRNTTLYDIHVPGGNMGYPAYWVRDSVMMLGGDFISAEELEGWIRLISGTLRGPEDWHVRPSVIVPAYAVPDHINFDGKPTFYPGNYETGEKQGGHAWGKYPPLDDNFCFITAVYEHWRLTRSLRLFHSQVKTSFGELMLSDLCEKVYQVPPSDQATGLVVAGDVEKENAKDWGFCDGEFKSGKLLFPSVLKYVAANQLAQLFEASGQIPKARGYRDGAARIRRAVPLNFFHLTQNQSEGWLHSATGVGNQPDVWGSAFAIQSGAVDTSIIQQVARALVRAFQEKTGVRQGCIRQILTTDRVNKGGWQLSISKLGAYQNGGYWGTPTGWYISAIDKVDPQAAMEMAKDYIQFLRTNMRADGMAQAWEWFNPDTGEHANPLYVATIALPYLSLKKAGLLSTH
jgi:ADP-ribose pyrophosphatase YjhB (NUDIX family)